MSVSVACAQMECVPFEVAYNLEQAGRLIEEAAGRGAELVVLPEFFNTGLAYDPRLTEVAEPLDGPTTEWMKRWSYQTGSYLGGCLVERAGPNAYDTFVLTTPSGEVLSYRKRFPALFEKLYFGRGRAVGILETRLARIGVMICWDMVHRRLLKELQDNVDLLVISSAWPDMTTGNVPLPGLQSWMTRQPRHRPQRMAQRLSVPVLHASATGRFDSAVPGLGLRYRCDLVGNSSIIDETGTPLVTLGRECAVIVEAVRVAPRGRLLVHAGAPALTHLNAPDRAGSRVVPDSGRIPR